MNRYLSDPEELNRILSNAADRASEISEPIVAEVRKIIGFSGV
jgi:tryptophanyl-tRNA synthetase